MPDAAVICTACLEVLALVPNGVPGQREVPEHACPYDDEEDAA